MGIKDKYIVPLLIDMDKIQKDMLKIQAEHILENPDCHEFMSIYKKKENNGH